MGALLKKGFYDSVMVSVIIYAVMVCWCSCISTAARRRLDMLVRFGLTPGLGTDGSQDSGQHPSPVERRVMSVQLLQGQTVTSQVSEGAISKVPFLLLLHFTVRAAPSEPSITFRYFRIGIIVQLLVYIFILPYNVFFIIFYTVVWLFAAVTLKHAHCATM